MRKPNRSSAPSSPSWMRCRIRSTGSTRRWRAWSNSRISLVRGRTENAYWPPNCNAEPAEEIYMRQFFGGIALAAILCAPVVMVAQEQTRRTTTTTTTRYYDPEYKTYHEWNDSERQAWERWQKDERHATSVHDFKKANKQEQRDYW